MLSTPLVRCGKCKFTFHSNDTNINSCPRCNAQLNPNLIQGGTHRDEVLRNLTRVLAFGQSDQQNKGLTNVPLGITPIDKEFAQSKVKRLQQGSNNNKQLRDLDRVLKEFA